MGYFHEVTLLFMTIANSPNKHLQYFEMFEYASDFFSAILLLVKAKRTRSEYLRPAFDTTRGYYYFITSHPLLWFLFLPFHVLILLLFPFFVLSRFIAKAIVYVIFASRIFSPTYVPAFYCPPSNCDGLLGLTIIPMFGSVFGGLHCVGWYFTFPSGAERLIWRIASLTVTFTPILALLVIPIL